MKKNILTEVQAGILEPYFRKNVKFYFVKFEGDRELINKWLKQLKITSASKQREYKADYKTKKDSKNYIDNRVITNLYISINGLLKLHEDNIDKRNTLRGLLKGSGSYFFQGMKEEGVIFRHNDPPIDKWKPFFYQEDIDALLVLAGSEIDSINNTLKDIGFKKEGYEEIITIDMEGLKGGRVGQIIGKETGHRMTTTENGETYPIEPFGYRDGITKVKFFNDRGNPEKNQTDIVLDKHNGSYLVFRKLKQNVKEFNKRVDELVGKYNKVTNTRNSGNVSKNPKKFIEGQIMGRFKDGVPIALWNGEGTVCPVPQSDIDKFNDFHIDANLAMKGTTYSSLDDIGQKCPIHAHIRKANPRDDNRKGANPGLFLPSSGNPIPPAIIARRGIPYKYTQDDQGLLFMCFQRDIFLQFSRIQYRWFNDNPYGKIDTGLDGVTGNYEKERRSTKQRWNKEWGKKDDFYFSFKDFVTLQGGEFFYAPPLSFFGQPDISTLISDELKRP